MKTTLTAVTPVGTVTRATATPYTHVVVWKSPRVWEAYLAHVKDPDARRLSGVQARWVKDKGYGVTWHNSQRTAENAANAGYYWDGRATLVGVYVVSTTS